jgi:UDP-glucose 4-epimerase
MKVLVTGGAGFVASHVVDALVENGHEAVVVDNLRSGERGNVPPGVPLHNIDIRSPELVRLLESERPEVVCHHAAQTTVKGSTSDPKYDADVNVMGMINLLQGCVSAGVRKVTFSSSGGTVYGNTQNLPVKETEPLRPVSPYGITKVAGEEYIEYFGENFGLKYTIMRYSNIYGPRDHASSEHVITVFIDRLLAGKTPVIHWDGEQSKDYLYVADCVAANLVVLTEGDNEVYNIGSGRPLSVNEIFREITRQMGVDVEPEYGPKRPGDVRAFYLDISKAERELGWAPRVSFEEGLARTIRSYREASASHA